MNGATCKVRAMETVYLQPDRDLHRSFLLRLDDLTQTLIEPEDLIAAAARMLGEHLGVERCAYADVEADEDTFNLTGDYNHGVPSIVGRYRFAQFGSECLRLLRGDLPYVVEDSEGDTRTCEVRDAYRKTLIRAVICVPVLKGGRLAVAMAVHQIKPRRWSPDEVMLVRCVANRCWESIERVRIARELRGSDARLRRALEAARQVAWEYDTSTQEIRCSYTAAGVLGIVPVRGGVRAVDWHNCIHHDDRAQRTQVLRQAHQDGGHYRAEFRWRRPDDGAVLWVEESGQVTADGVDDQPVGSGILADISARKSAEIERERFFTVGLELLVVANFAGHLQRVSPGWERLLGWSEAELTAQPWLTFIHPDDRPTAIVEAGRLLNGRDTTHFENRFRCKDGSWRWLSWRLRTYPDERLLYGAVTDVTEHKRRQRRDAFLLALDDALQPLADPEAILTTTVRLLGDHLEADRCVHAVYEPDGDLVILADPCQRGGLPPLNGRMPLNTFGEELGRQLRANVAVRCDEVAQDDAIGEARTRYVELGVGSQLAVPLVKGGTLAVVWFIQHATPRRWQADDIEVVRSAADRCWESSRRARATVELRQQWSLFDSVLSHTPDFTYIFSREGRFVYVNRALLSLWQKPLADAVGRNFFDLGYPVELAARLQDQIQEVVSRHAVVRDQTPFTGPDGITRHYEYIFVPVYSESGEIEAVAGSTRDISDRLLIEEALRRANDKLMRSNRELEQFAYIASHDLQEPLRMVTSFITLLEARAGDSLNDTARTYIARAMSGTKRMRTLIHDLLAYARVGEPRPFAAVDLTKVMTAAIDNLSAGIAEVGAEVTVDALPMVWGDEGLLIQLFQNLIGNALKFRASGRAVIIQVAVAAGTGAWTICVRDNGIGIAENQRERIFEVFHRAHTNREIAGTGIGLAICKKIVEQHGGSIAVASEKGLGSTFLVSLPRHDLPSG